MDNPTSLQDAIHLACQAHLGDWREGEAPLPYVTHPVEVMMNLRFVGGVTDVDLLVAAVLHDTVECGQLKLDQIESKFGSRVRALVAEVTREEPTAEAVKGLTKDQIWELRAEMLLQEIKKMSPDAQRIKLADRLANVRDAKRTKSPRKLRRYLSQTEKILDAIPRKTNKPLWDAIGEEL